MAPQTETPQTDTLQDDFRKELSRVRSRSSIPDALIPQVEAPVRTPTRGYKIGDKIKMYGQDVTVVGFRLDGSPIVDQANLKSQAAVESSLDIQKEFQDALKGIRAKAPKPQAMAPVPPPVPGQPGVAMAPGGYVVKQRPGPPHGGQIFGPGGYTWMAIDAVRAKAPLVAQGKSKYSPEEQEILNAVEKHEAGIQRGLEATKKYAIDPFERMSAAGAKAGAEIIESGIADPSFGMDPELARFTGVKPPTIEEHQKNLERFRKEYPAVAGISRGVGGVVGGVATDPRYWPLMFTGGPEMQVVEKGLQAGFTVQMATGAIEGVQQYRSIKNDPNVPEDQKYEVLTSAVVSGIMAAHGTRGMFKGKPMPGPLPREVAAELQGLTDAQRAEVFKKVQERLVAKGMQFFPGIEITGKKRAPLEMAPLPEEKPLPFAVTDRRGQEKPETEKPIILDVPVLDASERLAKRMEMAEQEARTLIAQERQRAIDEEGDRKKRIEDEVARQQEREMAIRERRTVAPAGSEERMSEVMDRFRQLGEAMDRKAEENQYVDGADMVRSLLEKKPRGKALTPEENEVLKMWDERKRLVQFTEPGKVEPVITEFGKERLDAEGALIEREQKIREAAEKMRKKASESSTPEESQAAGEQADEATRRAEQIKTEVDRQRAEREAAAEKKKMYPAGPPVDTLRGKPTSVRLPDGRTLPGRYAVVKADDLVISHDPKTFQWNEEYEPRRLQPRDYEKNKEAQAGVIAGGQDFQESAIHNTDDTGHNGPPVILADGRVAGGNGRAMRLMRAHDTEQLNRIHADLVDKAWMFGFDPEEIPKADERPVLVRVLDDTPEDLTELVNLGQDLNRTETRGFTQAEQSVMSGERLSPETMEWLSKTLDKMDDGIRDLMRLRGNELVEKLMQDGLFEPTKRAQFVTSAGELTEDAKRLFENALLGKVIDDPDLIATMPPSIKNKLFRSLASLSKIKAADPAWDFTDYLQEAIRNWKRIDAVGNTLDAYGKKDTPLAEKWYAYQKGKMIPEPPDHPAVEALTRRLEDSSKDVKEAFTRYADEIEGKQEGLSFRPPANPREAFNRHIAEKAGVEVKDREWGSLRPEPAVEEVREIPDVDPEMARMPLEELQADYQQVRELYGDDDPITESYKAELERRNAVPEPFAEPGRVMAPPPPEAAPEAKPAPMGMLTEDQAKVDIAKEVQEAIRTTGPLTEAKLRDILSKHPEYSPGKVNAILSVWQNFAEKYLGKTFDQWLQENVAGVEIMGEGPRVPEEGEVPTGILFQPLEDKHLEIIREGGAIPVGIQEGFGTTKALALFDDPTTKSTLAIPVDELTVERVRKRLEDHRAERERFREMYKGKPLFQKPEFGAGMSVDELASWAKAAGRKLKVEDYGEQLGLFGDVEKVYRLTNGQGQSVLVNQRHMDAIRAQVPEVGAKVAEEGGTIQGTLFQVATSPSVLNGMMDLGTSDGAWISSGGEFIHAGFERHAESAARAGLGGNVDEAVNNGHIRVAKAGGKTSIQVRSISGRNVEMLRDVVATTRGQVVFELGAVKDGLGEDGFKRFTDAIEADAWLKSKSVLRQGKKGAVQFLEDGRALVHLMESADISTVFHEFAHIARRNLKPEDRAVVEKWLKVDQGVWHVDHEEKFARSFERYLYNGEAPTPEMKSVFSRIRDWMLDVYKAVKGSSINIRIPVEVSAVFDRMVAGIPEEFKEPKVKTEPEELPAKIKSQAKKIQAVSERQGELLTPEERLASSKIAEGGEDFAEDMADAKFRIFPDAQQAIQWAKTNGKDLKGVKLYQMDDGRAFAHFLPRDLSILFQESDPVEIDRRIRMIDERLGKLIPEAERSKLGKMRQDLVAQKQQTKLEMAPPPGGPVIKLWTPEGEVEVGGERGPAERPGAVPDVPAPFQEPKRVGEVPELPGRPAGAEPRGAAGRGVSRPPAVGRGARPSGEPRSTLPDVQSAKLDAPVRNRGEVVYEAKDWTDRVKTLGLPDNAPAPTVRIPNSVRRMLIFPGQVEIVESALSGLKQHDAYVIASPTGSGKSWTQATIVSQLYRPGMKVLVLTTSKDLIHQRGNGLIPVYRDFDVDLKELPSGVSDPREGIFASTYATAIGREGIENVPWDLIVADEIGEARKWYSSQRGAMMKAMAGNAKKVLYLSATPFHTALELGHMDKLGLWKDQGFDAWGRQFGVYKDAEGNWAGGNAPKKLLKLREQLIERGQFIGIKKDLEGFNTSFAQVPLTDEQIRGIKNIREAFAMAEDYYKRRGKKSMIRAARANAVTYIKKYLERSRLPQAVELAKKLEKEGWKVIIFSETKTERNEVFDFLKQPDEDMGGRISELLPPLPGVSEVLGAEFGDDIANYSGPHSAARTAEKEGFLDDSKKHIYVSYAAGGIGVSLHDTVGNKPRAVIYLGPPYSGVMFDQAIGRAWRYGTKSNVHAIFLTSNARPEIDMVASKIAPRMSSLRALVSGIDNEDKFVNTLHRLDSEREKQAAYELGQGMKYDASDYEDVMPTHAVQSWKDVKIEPASMAMNKGMKMPETGAAPGVIRLFQGDEFEPPEEFALPEDRKADMENEGLKDNYVAGKTMPGISGEELPAATRKQAGDVIEKNAKNSSSDSTDAADKEGVVREQWHQDAGFMQTAFDYLKGTRVAKAAKAFDMYMFTHGRKVIRRMAKDGGNESAGKQISRSISDFHVVWGNTAGPWVHRYIEILRNNDISSKRQVRFIDKAGKAVEVNEHHNMVMAKQGKQPPANARIAKAVSEVTQLFQSVKDTLAKEGVVTEIFEDGARRFVPFSEQMNDPGYWPRKYDLDYEIRNTDPETGITETTTLRDLIGGELGQATRERMIKGMMRDHGLSRYQVEDWLASRHRDHPLVGNVERARQYDIPYYRTDVDVATSYLQGAGEAVARTRVFGQRRQKLERLIEGIPLGKERRGVREIMDSMLSSRYMQDDTRAFMGVIADWSVMTKMPFSAVKVLGHSAWAPLSANTRSYLRGLFEGITDYREARERAMVSGAILEQYKNAALKEFGVKRGSVGSKFLGYVQFHHAYEFGRIVSDATARQYLTRYALPKLRDRKSVDYYRRNLKEVYLLDDTAIDNAISTGSWSEEDLNRAGKALADKTMFTNDPTELPPAWRARSENEIADFTLGAVRAVTLLKGYSLKTGAMLRERLIDEARKGNFRPWIPFILISPALGEMINQFNSMFRSNKKKAEEELKPGGMLWKAAEDIGHMTGWSTLEMIMEMIANPGSHGRGDVSRTTYEFFLGPAASDLVHTIFQLPYELTNAKTDSARMNALKRWARSSFPASKIIVPPPERKGMNPIPSGGSGYRMSPLPGQ